MYISKSKISYPISVDSVKRHTQITVSEDDDDSYIRDVIIKSAIEFTEGQINQDIAYTNNTVAVNDFSSDKLIINQGNYNAITEILNNDTSTAITFFDIEKGYFDFKIKFNSTINCESLTVKFTTGFENESDVPSSLKYAILVKCADIFDNERTSYSYPNSKYNETWERMCKQHKLL